MWAHDELLAAHLLVSPGKLFGRSVDGIFFFLVCVCGGRKVIGYYHRTLQILINRILSLRSHVASLATYCLS
jgi:hypothetical protein